MAEPKGMKYEDRQQASAAAKKAMLERFKPKPHVTDPDLEARKAAAAAELEAVRAARNAARKKPATCATPPASRSGSRRAALTGEPSAGLGLR
jgi:hypothetical protein